MSELDPPEEPQDSDLSATEVGKPDGEPATWSRTDIDAVVTRANLDALYPEIDTSWIADLVPKLDAPHIAGLDALYPKIDTSWIADLVPKLDAPHIAGLDALYRKIEAPWIAGLDALHPKLDTSWIADLIPKLDAPHIAGLDALYPKLEAPWIAGLDALHPKIEAPWIAGLDALHPKLDTSWIADLVPKLEAPWIADLESLLPRFDSSWFELLADVVRQRVRSFPPNWLTVSTVDVFDDDKLRSIVLDEGIPLAWVPGSSLIERLLAAQDAAHRRELIRNGWRGIVNDCVQAATGLPSRQGRTHARFITLGASAIRDGHHEAAQALAANLVDTLGNSYVKAAVAGYSWSIVTAKNLRPKLSALAMRTLMVLGPLAVGHTAFRPDDAIPRVFSRHATAHGVSRRQYTRVNSLIALMNATALLCWLERDCGAFSAD